MYVSPCTASAPRGLRANTGECALGAYKVFPCAVGEGEDVAAGEATGWAACTLKDHWVSSCGEEAEDNGLAGDE